MWATKPLGCIVSTPPASSLQTSLLQKSFSQNVTAVIEDESDFYFWKFISAVIGKLSTSIMSIMYHDNPTLRTGKPFDDEMCCLCLHDFDSSYTFCEASAVLFYKSTT